MFRAKLILLLADGMMYEHIITALGTTKPTIARWKARFEEAGMDGLQPRHKGSQPRAATPSVQARVVRRAQQKPTTAVRIGHAASWQRSCGSASPLCSGFWRKRSYGPHRLDRYMASNDPQFEQKAADIIGLYLNPPQHAAVFCVDEKTAIQALDRLDPVLPLSPGRAERHGFEYYRHGTLSLYAALNVKTGQVQGKTARRHASADFIDVSDRPDRQDEMGA